MNLAPIAATLGQPRRQKLQEIGHDVVTVAGYNPIGYSSSF